MKSLSPPFPLPARWNFFDFWFVILIFDFCILIFDFPCHAQEKPFDYVIKDASVFDGVSLVPSKQDIAIAGGRIVQLGRIAAEEAREVVRAEGLVASAGFIDIHTHSDFNPFIYPNLGNKVLQGVTTEVVGNCGMSAAPIAGPHEGEIANVWGREGVRTPQTIPWKNFADYANEAEFQGLDTNFLSLVGHGNLRSSVMGMEPRAAGPEEIASMKTLLRRSLHEGAFGISFGLGYLPGTFASKEELVTLCQEAGAMGGICVFHIRSEGKALTEAVREAIAIGRQAGAAVHISHLKASGSKNWTKIHSVFKLIEEARASGLQVTADAYPYEAGLAELGVILPEKFYRDPSRAGRFKDSREKRRILRELRKHYEANPVSWDRIRIASVMNEKNFALQGKTILAISEAAEKPAIETLVDLLADEEFKVSAFYFSQDESIVNQILAKPYVAVGSDSIADGSRLPHPRAYGTFPRLLARCAGAETAGRELCWSRILHQMTALPAEILGLKDRGKIAAGHYADLVLFDPKTVQDRADYENPLAPPNGIQWVFVNGNPVVREGKYQPAHSGLFLLHEQ